MIFQTKHNYKYPHEEPINEKKNVIEYWGKRGISKNVIDYLDIREDKNGNGVFNFYRFFSSKLSSSSSSAIINALLSPNFSLAFSISCKKQILNTALVNRM